MYSSTDRLHRIYASEQKRFINVEILCNQLT